MRPAFLFVRCIHHPLNKVVGLVVRFSLLCLGGSAPPDYVSADALCRGNVVLRAPVMGQEEGKDRAENCRDYSQTEGGDKCDLGILDAGGEPFLVTRKLGTPKNTRR